MTDRELLLEPVSDEGSLVSRGHGTVRKSDKRADYFIYIYPLSKKPQTQWSKRHCGLPIGPTLAVCSWLPPTRPPGPWGSGRRSRVTARRARCPFLCFLCLTTYARHYLVCGLIKFSSSTFHMFQASRTALKYTMNEFKLTMTRWGGFPGGASGKEPSHQCRRRKRLGSDPWVGKMPYRRAWQPTPVFLSGENHGQRSLAGYSPWGRKESDTTERLHLQLELLVLVQVFHEPHYKHRRSN